MKKEEIAGLIHQLGVASELLGENPFKALAYHSAARTLLGLEELVAVLLTEGRLGELPGFGKALVEKIGILVSTGRLPQLEERLEKLPPGLFEILRIEGLGVKRVRRLWTELEVTNPGELEYACLENRLAELPGFGSKSQANVLDGIERLKRYQKRRLYPEASAAASELREKVSAFREVARCTITGSLRRLCETVGDLDLLVLIEGDGRDAFAAELGEADWVEGLDQPSDTKFAFRYRGIEVDLRLAGERRWGTALVVGTGSTAHVDELRGLAGERGADLDGIETAAEEGLYRSLALPFIPPELREGLGEIEAARRGELPNLIENRNIRGVFHVHTEASDGAQSLEGVVRLGEELGYSYVGISEHSRSAFYAGGLTVDDIYEQAERIAEINGRGSSCRLLHGIESDILADGSLDYPDEVLESLDFVIASVHSGLSMPRDTATERILAAVKNPMTTILGHPTGRLLLAREGYELDWDRVLEALAEHRVALELNTCPHRLDADWRVLRRARDFGIEIAVNPDAHRRTMFDTVPLGVGIARKGWLTPENVLNTKELPELLSWLADRRG